MWDGAERLSLPPLLPLGQAQCERRALPALFPTNCPGVLIFPVSATPGVSWGHQRPVGGLDVTVAWLALQGTRKAEPEADAEGRGECEWV